jgi:hypothetical protein
MATATSRKAAPNKAVVAKSQRLATELLDFHHKLAKQFARMDAIKDELKNIATKSDNFKVVVVGKGSVSVAGAKGKAFNGKVPEIITEAWLALKPAERERLEKRGLVVETESYTQAFGGRVTVNVI